MFLIIYPGKTAVVHLDISGPVIVLFHRITVSVFIKCELGNINILSEDILCLNAYYHIICAEVVFLDCNNSLAYIIEIYPTVSFSVPTTRRQRGL